jgi:hypothetical protein
MGLGIRKSSSLNENFDHFRILTNDCIMKNGLAISKLDKNEKKNLNMF